MIRDRVSGFGFQNLWFYPRPLSGSKFQVAKSASTDQPRTSGFCDLKASTAQSNTDRIWNLKTLHPAPFFLLFTFYFLLSFSTAQQWTIQTVAFRDYRDAQAAEQQLQALGFEAYVEFSNGEDGLQYARVRVGCFDSKETADLTVQRLIGSYTKEAVAMPMNAGAPVPYCVRREVGFITPTTWYTYFTSATEAAFMVDLQGKQAFLKHDGITWHMGQTLGDIGITTIPASVTNSGYFSEVAASPSAQILYRSDMTILVTQGKLLWQKGTVAVVQENDMIVAYHVEKR